MPTAVPQIQCQRVSHSLRSGQQDLQILDQIEFDIDRGEFVAVVGPSGSGKSTLLGILAGLERPKQGSVRFEGKQLEDASEDELALWRRDNLSARENILLPLELIGLKDAGARADALLEEVGLGSRGHHYPSQLSGGEQQRVALARAFGHGPDVLFADEPTGNLDMETGARALDLLLRLREAHGTTLVLVTHDTALAEKAGRRLRLVGGQLVHDSSNPDVGA
ncbi:UNVERIFIED_CONTAM: hypothetical protein GTU68_008575 [Idotea baltica]|nr:hypothetical protein [Idotea baltica]